MPSTVRSRDQVGLELRDHGQDVEQQSSDGISGVVDQPAQIQADVPRGEFVRDRSGVGKRPGEAVELGDRQGVAGSAGGESFSQARALTVGAGQAVVDVDALGLDTETEQGVALRSEVLCIGGASGVPDK